MTPDATLSDTLSETTSRNANSALTIPHQTPVSDAPDQSLTSAESKSDHATGDDETNLHSESNLLKSLKELVKSYESTANTTTATATANSPPSTKRSELQITQSTNGDLSIETPDPTSTNVWPNLLKIALPSSHRKQRELDDQRQTIDTLVSTVNSLQSELAKSRDQVEDLTSSNITQQGTIHVLRTRCDRLSGEKERWMAENRVIEEREEERLAEVAEAERRARYERDKKWWFLW